MATTKATTAVWNSQTLTAGAGDTTSSAVDLQDGYGATAHIKLTNGATGPTVAAQVQIQLSADDSEYYNMGGPLVGQTGANAVQSWAIDLPFGTKYAKFVAGSNTGQDVTADLDVSEVTAIN